MSSFDQRILDALKAEPKLSAIRLADRLDADPADVKASLLFLATDGKIRCEEVPGLNGVKQNVYSLKPSAFNWQGHTDVKTESASTAPSKAGTNGDRAIAYLKEHGPTEAKALAQAIGLNYASELKMYLAGPLKRCEIQVVGTIWSLPEPMDGCISKIGIVTSALPGLHSDSRSEATLSQIVETSTTGEPANPGKLQESNALHDETKFDLIAAACAPSVRTITVQRPSLDDKDVDARKAPILRAGIWSDGMVELQSDGRHRTQITREELDFLADFRDSLRAKDAA